MKRSVNPNASTTTDPRGSPSLPTQLLATKFFVPVAPGPLICRPRLTALLDKSLKYPFTLVSAPAGFGKTTLLASWVQSSPANHLQLAWLSLDEEDNDPQLFWTYVLSALAAQQPDGFSSLLESLQSPHAFSLKSQVVALINLMTESTHRMVLILDDYQLITQEQIHSALAYLVEHLPAQLHIIVSTRADPPLPLSILRARQWMLEVHTDQLRCTTQETSAFFQEVRGIHLPEKLIQEITARTEGWLVGLHLLGLSLPEGTDPLAVLQEVSGNQRYILDYLTQEVLQRQLQEVQTFLLSTCILERLTASLCDAVIQQTNSQQMLKQLEQANLFVVSLDSKQQWYRYHTLFAQALRYQLEQRQPDLLLTLHSRASLWYAQHNQILRAVLHAFSAKEWHRAADLIEETPSLLSYAWAASEHEQVLLREWLEQLPAEVVHSRPRLCLACVQLLWAVAPASRLQTWLAAAEATLTATLPMQIPADPSATQPVAQTQQDQKELLGEVMATCAFLQSFQEDGQATLLLCQQALALLSAENLLARVLVGWSQLMAYYASSANNARVAIESGLQAVSFAKAAGQPALAIGIMSTTACYMRDAGQLHEAQQLAQQAIQLGRQPGDLLLPEVGWPTLAQAEILREWNQLDAALSLAKEALERCKHAESFASLIHLLCGYATLTRIHLSRGELNAARSALQQFEHIGMNMSEEMFTHLHALLTTTDRVRLWLACGELDCAMDWTKKLDGGMRYVTPFAREREEVAQARIFLAQSQPTLALQRLEPVLQRATSGQRWGHVVEMRLLQALAYQMCHEEMQALSLLSEAVRLTEPESSIRSFVDEGPPLEALLSRLREKQREDGPTPYLDTLLAAFQQESKEHESQPERLTEHTAVQPLLEPLTKRELQVLRLLAQGASNQEIAQELVIALDTVKRHVSHIFSKLGVNNRVQAVRQARECDLLSEKP